MQRTDVAKIMAILKAAYQNFYKGADSKAAFELWAEMFADDDPVIVASAVKSYIAADTKGFPPSIGQIKEKIRLIEKPADMTEVEAWGFVKKAIRNSAYHAQEEWNKLPAIIQGMITPEQLRDFALSDVGDESVNSSNFMRSYRSRKAEARNFDTLPDSVKALIQEQTERLGLGCKTY